MTIKKILAVLLCTAICTLVGCSTSAPQLSREEIALQLTLQAIESKAIPMYYHSNDYKDTRTAMYTFINSPATFKENFKEWDTYNAKQISDFYNSILHSISANSDSK